MRRLRLAAGVLAALSIEGCVADRERLIYVPEADFKTAAAHTKISARLDATILREEGRSFPLDGHVVESGSGLVLAVYRDRIRRFTSDGDSFEYLTIQLSPKFKPVYAIPEDGVAFYSSGSRSFLSRSGCVGYARSGTVKIEEFEPSGMRAVLELDFQTISPVGVDEECDPIVLRETFRFKRSEQGISRP